MQHVLLHQPVSVHREAVLSQWISARCLFRLVNLPKNYLYYFMYRDELTSQSSFKFVRSDSINSETTVQSAIAFEKCSQLFNMAALFSSLASHQVLALFTLIILFFFSFFLLMVTSHRCDATKKHWKQRRSCTSKQQVCCDTSVSVSFALQAQTPSLKFSRLSCTSCW